MNGNQSTKAQGERLAHARKAAGYDTPADAARAIGTKEPTYNGHENGNRGMSRAAPRYADFFRVSLDWLVKGIGPMRRDLSGNHASESTSTQTEKPVERQLTSGTLSPHEWPRDVPILGTASCGDDGMFELNGQTHDHAKRPPRLSAVKDSYALWVSGSSMIPWRKPGDLVFVHPHHPINIGDFVVVQLHAKSGDGVPAYIKQLVRRTAKDLRLAQFNPAEEITIPMSKVAKIHRIVDWSELLGI